MLSISFLYEKLFFIAESFSFSVIAMVCLSANHEWSQYLNIGIGVLKFSLSLCLSLSFSFPRVRAYGEVSTRYAQSQFSQCTFSNVFTLLLHLLLHMLTAPCIASCFMIGSALVTLHDYCPSAELCNVFL